MPRRSIRAAVNLVVALAMTIGMLLSAGHVVASHNAFSLAAAKAAQHGGAMAAADEHGHSHDEGDTAEQPQGHVHGHNPGDHVHEPVALSVLATPGAPSFSTSSGRPSAETSELDIKSSLKRPPRSVLA